MPTAVIVRRACCVEASQQGAPVSGKPRGRTPLSPAMDSIGRKYATAALGHKGRGSRERLVPGWILRYLRIRAMHHDK